MRVYIIGNDGITLCREPPAAVNEGEIVVASNEELHAAELSGKRLLALWNALPDVERRRKVGDRGALIDQMWSAIEALPDPEQQSDTKRPSKQDAVIAMLQRPEGATVDEVASAMGWQRHTVRGLFSGTLKKKLGLTLASAHEERGRVYRIAAPRSDPAQSRGGRHHAPQARHRRLFGDPARHDPDRKARRLARSGLEGPLLVRYRLRLECRRDGRPRHRLRDPHFEDARANRGDEADLDQGHRRVLRNSGNGRGCRSRG